MQMDFLESGSLLHTLNGNKDEKIEAKPKPNVKGSAQAQNIPITRIKGPLHGSK